MYIDHIEFINGRLVKDEYYYSNHLHPCPPGELIGVLIDEFKHWSNEKFAAKMGFKTMDVYELLNGMKPVTQPLAAKLAKVLGASEQFWLRQETLYRTHLASLARRAANASDH